MHTIYQASSTYAVSDKSTLVQPNQEFYFAAFTKMHSWVTAPAVSACVTILGDILCQTVPIEMEDIVGSHFFND